MTETATLSTRTRLLYAAARLVAADPGEEISLRAVCADAGVKMPTLYHFFGSKRGLLDGVIEYGFDLYLAEKSALESTGDPIQDIRAGWDAHVAFGLNHPGFYALMYGEVRPGHAPAAQSRPTALLRELTERASDQGRLVVDPEQAAAHILAANVGVTLRQIVAAQEDRPLADAVREATIAAITGTVPEGERAGVVDRAAREVIERAASQPDLLGPTETRLLIEWVRRLGTHR